MIVHLKYLKMEIRKIFESTKKTARTSIIVKSQGHLNK